MSKLTILSTNYRSEFILNLNHELSNNTNEWIVVCNDGEPCLKYPYTLLHGIEMPISASTNSLTNKHSMHHALALNKGCKFVNDNRKDSEFLLIVDPDFFIIPEHEEVMDHMRKNDLSFFGAPYWPDGKNRLISDFPVAFCMYVDLTKVDISNWDFSPIYNAKTVIDTGYQVYNKYYEDKDCFETVRPSKIKEHFSDKAPSIKADTYSWGDKMFGIHVHAKVHLRPNESFRMKSVLNRVKAVGKFIKYAKKQYSTTV